MPKMGRSLFSGARQLRERRNPGRQSHAGRRGDEMSGLGRQRIATSPTCYGDEEAPQLAPRFLQKEAKHFAPQFLEKGTIEEGSRVLGEGYEGIELQSGLSGRNIKKDMDVKYKEAADRISEARDEHWAEKRRELGADCFDEDDVLMAYAKEQLLLVGSTSELMMTAEVLIDEDWLGNVDTLPGNIYRLAVMGDIFVSSEGESWTSQAQTFAKILGVLAIVAIQFVGPPLIFLSRFVGAGVLKESWYHWHCCPWHWDYNPGSSETCTYNDTAVEDVSYFDDWHHVATTKIMGLLMMLTFILNGLFVILAERHSWKQIYNTFRYLDVKNPRFKLTGMYFMYLDAIVNTWVVVWCCMDVYVLIGAALCPSDVLMNALGLVFLYNLDDVGGDLGFVNDDDWPGLRLAWIYQEVVKPKTEDPLEAFDEDKLDMGGWLTIKLYELMICLLVLLSVGIPTLAALTPFIQIVP